MKKRWMSERKKEKSYTARKLTRVRISKSYGRNTKDAAEKRCERRLIVLSSFSSSGDNWFDAREARDDQIGAPVENVNGSRGGRGGRGFVEDDEEEGIVCDENDIRVLFVTWMGGGGELADRRRRRPGVHCLMENCQPGSSSRRFLVSKKMVSETLASRLEESLCAMKIGTGLVQLLHSNSQPGCNIVTMHSVLRVLQIGVKLVWTWWRHFRLLFLTKEFDSLLIR